MKAEPKKIPMTTTPGSEPAAFRPLSCGVLMNSRSIAAYWGKLMALMLGSREPIIGSVEITNECNLRCRHCFWWATRSPHAELGVEDWRALLRREYLDRGITGIGVSGGELLLRTDVIRMMLDEGFHLWVFTNGILPLPDLPLTYCVSLEGTEKSHDKIRGRGSYRKTKRNILSCPHDGVFLNMTLNTLNMREPASLVDEWKGKVQKISFGFHTPWKPRDPLWIPFGKARNEVIDELLRLKKKDPDFIFNTEGQLRTMMTGSWTKTCPAWFLRALDSSGRPKRCALGDTAICGKCGVDCYAGISSALGGEMLEWVKNMTNLLLRPNPKRP
jgi:Fe-coproporphyrin III synthase